MKLTYSDGQYIATSTYQEREIPKRAGFRWHTEKRHWFTRDVTSALRLVQYADDETKARLNGQATATLYDRPCLLTYRDGRYEAQVRRDTIDLPYRAGFTWNKRYQRWIATDSYFATRLIEFADPPTRARIEREESQRLARLTASRATDSDIPIPAPDGYDYMPFQRAGIAYALGQPAALVADEMGLGKTVQALGVINCLSLTANVLILCPASLKINWQRECKRWLVNKRLAVRIVTPDYWPSRHSLLERDQGAVMIINYDIIGKYQRQIAATAWDILVMDECHYIKNPDAQRTKLAQQIKASRRLLLTGTPICNRPRELWPLIHFLDPLTWNNKQHFTGRYCAAVDTVYGRDDKGASNLDELQERLRGCVMVRRLKSEVLTELPPKRRQMIELPAIAAVLDRERKVQEDYKAIIAQLKAQTEQASVSEDEGAYRDSVKALRQAQFTAGIAELAKIRHETALAKVPAVIEHLRDCLDTGGKVVLFAHHHDVINQIAEPFGSAAVKLTGENTMPERQAVVDRFQTDPECKLFIGSITAAGVGLTLTASSHVVFAELDWVPGNMRQAEDRCHRIGQRDSVLVQYIVMEGSLDAQMAQQLVEKEEVIEQALDLTAAPDLFSEVTA